MKDTLWQRVSPEERRKLLPLLKTAPIPLGAIASALGLNVKIGTLAHGKSGQIMRDANAPSGYAIRVNRHETKERQRFTLAHEIAHYLLHRNAIGEGIEESVLYRTPGFSSRMEVEANRLAADILMPPDLIEASRSGRNHPPDEDEAAELADRFRVSVPAMSIRLGL